jgi:hypothetical protein
VREGYRGREEREESGEREPDGDRGKKNKNERVEEREGEKG